MSKDTEQKTDGKQVKSIKVKVKIKMKRKVSLANPRDKTQVSFDAAAKSPGAVKPTYRKKRGIGSALSSSAKFVGNEVKGTLANMAKAVKGSNTYYGARTSIPQGISNILKSKRKLNRGMKGYGR
jgi:hypothetical protein